MKKNSNLFVAELCQNHNGKFKNIERMVNECAKYGADIIKLQNIYAKDLTFRYQFENGFFQRKKILCIKRPYKSEYERLKKLEINYKDLEKFIKICEKNKVSPSITCFTRNSVKNLKNIGFKIIKIASYDCASFMLIREIASNFKRVILSTGATYDDEITMAVKILKEHKTDFKLLHCVSIYPTPFNMLNLNRIQFLKKFTQNVGYSDHTIAQSINKNAASLYSIFFGAKIIERHVRILDIDKTKDGKVSIKPEDIEEIKYFYELNHQDQAEYLKEKYNFNIISLAGKKNRELSSIELLNRDYYRGRFANTVRGENIRTIYNWEESQVH